MRLYMKQKVFTFGDQFSIYNENGEVVYTVEGEVFTFGKKLHLLDTRGNELLYISERAFSFMPRYEVYRGDDLIAEVVREFRLFSSGYRVEYLGWQVEGEIFDHDYQIFGEDDHLVAQMSKQWFTWGDSYEIDIRDDGNVEVALAVMLAIDVCIEKQQQS